MKLFFGQRRDPTRGHFFNAADALGDSTVEGRWPDDALHELPGEFQPIRHRQLKHRPRQISGYHGPNATIVIARRKNWNKGEEG